MLQAPPNEWLGHWHSQSKLEVVKEGGLIKICEICQSLEPFCEPWELSLIEKKIKYLLGIDILVNVIHEGLVIILQFRQLLHVRRD